MLHSLSLSFFSPRFFFLILVRKNRKINEEKFFIVVRVLGVFLSGNRNFLLLITDNCRDGQRRLRRRIGHHSLKRCTSFRRFTGSERRCFIFSSSKSKNKNQNWVGIRNCGMRRRRRQSSLFTSTWKYEGYLGGRRTHESKTIRIQFVCWRVEKRRKCKTILFSKKEKWKIKRMSSSKTSLQTRKRNNKKRDKEKASVLMHVIICLK